MDATERLGAVVILIGMGSALAYPVLQVIALRQFRGFWRLLAAVPLLPMGYIIVVTALALRQQSNLWPLLLIFIAPLGFAYLGILWLVHSRLASPRNT